MECGCRTAVPLQAKKPSVRHGGGLESEVDQEECAQGRNAPPPSVSLQYSSSRRDFRNSVVGQLTVAYRRLQKTINPDAYVLFIYSEFSLCRLLLFVHTVYL